MSTILVLNSSISGDASVSRILVEEAVSRLLEAEPGAMVVPARSWRRTHPAPDPHQLSRRQGCPLDGCRTRRPCAVRSTNRGIARGRHDCDRRANVQFQHPDRSARLVRLRPARRGNFQLFGGRPEGSARRQACHRHRIARRPLQRRSRAGDRLPGAVSAPFTRIHGASQRRIHPR